MSIEKAFEFLEKHCTLVVNDETGEEIQGLYEVTPKDLSDFQRESGEWISVEELKFLISLLSNYDSKDEPPKGLDPTFYMFLDRQKEIEYRRKATELRHKLLNRLPSPPKTES